MFLKPGTWYLTQRKTTLLSALSQIQQILQFASKTRRMDPAGAGCACVVSRY